MKYLIVFFSFAVFYSLSASGESLTLTSPAFFDGGVYPKKYTCFANRGKNSVSPPLVRENIPENAKSVVLVMKEQTTDKIYWLVYDAGAKNGVCTEGAGQVGRPVACGGTQGANDFNEIGYRTPCEHFDNKKANTYIFTLYALDKRLNAKPGLTYDKIENLIKPHIIETETLEAIYEKTYAGTVFRGQ